MSDQKFHEQESSSSMTTALTADEFITRLRNALRKDGDFPASAKIVSELRQLTSDPKTTANQLTEVILREPSLGTRILHLVNSSFYRRVKPIMTVSQAVVQIGMKPLAELCAGLVLLQKFVPIAKRGGTFATCLQKTIVTSLLSSSLTPEIDNPRGSKSDECGFLAGSFAEMGTLLLAFYFPKVYEAALKRSDNKRQDISQSIQELTGLSPVQLSIEVIDSLDLPPFYKDVLIETTKIERGARPTSTEGAEQIQIVRVAKALCAAQDISKAAISNKSKSDLERVIESLEKKIAIDGKVIKNVLRELPKLFDQHCSIIELNLPSLPDFISSVGTGAMEDEESVPAGEPEAIDFTKYVEEVREAIENREPMASIVTTVMETLAWALGFDRVLLLLVGHGRKRLVGRMMLGKAGDIDPREIERSLGNDAEQDAVDIKAFRESKPSFGGKPVLPGGTSIAAIPIGSGSRTVGVIYADRVSSRNDLLPREQAAMKTLAELLERAVGIGA